MKYFFPIHLNGDNRGCEAIAKGTALILQDDKSDLIGLCTDAEIDKKLHINQFFTLIPLKKESIKFRIYNKIFRLLFHSAKKRKWFKYRYLYSSFLDMMEKNDVMVSTGGDMMCYDDNQVNYTALYVANNNLRSILWGCSIGEDNLTEEKIAALKSFSLIYARESLTKCVLESHGFSNVVVFPDPAFVLKPVECQLPSCFDNNEVIGFNVSNFVNGGFNLNTPFSNEILSLFHYILSETDFSILLIPHVFWENQDDRIILQNLLSKYKDEKRIQILDSYNLNYCEIRYVISHCKYFIGARTHAVISAYYSCVPSIALGYSIKSRGIAYDLSLPKWSVVDSKNIEKGCLVNIFKQLMENDTSYRNLLKRQMPEYIKKPFLLRGRL